MRITESQLRRIVRQEILKEGLTAGPITSAADFKHLVPGDRITVNGKPAVVINYDSFGASLSYAWEGTSTVREMDARLAWSWEPGELPEQRIEFVGPGAPIKAPGRAPVRRSPPSYYD